MLVNPRQTPTTLRPQPQATSTPAAEQSSKIKILEAITGLNYGLEKQRSELHKQLHELIQRVESIQLTYQKHEFGTSLPSEDRVCKQRECLAENGSESCSDGFDWPSATRTETGSCINISEVPKTKPVVRPGVFNGPTSWEDSKAQF